MKKAPKFTLGLAIITIALFFILAKVAPSTIRNVSTFRIDSARNQFNLSFKLAKSDQVQFSESLSILKLPSKLIKGANFELDSTASANLAFVAPVTGEIELKGNTVNFKGNVQRATVARNLPFQRFNFPQNLNFAMSAANLTNTTQNYLNIPPEIAGSIASESFPSNQIIASFGHEPKIIYIFKTGNFDATAVKELSPVGEYKLETSDGVNLYILKNITLFEIGEFTFVTSDPDSAKAAISALKNKGSLGFPQAKEGILSLIYLNSDKNPAPQSLLTKVLGSSAKTPKFLKNISRLEFTLQNKSFTGSIQLK